jgi:hypothetical protein
MKIAVIIAACIISLSASSQGKFYGGNGDGFATASLTNVVLPVEELNFTGARNGRPVSLHVSFSSSEAIRIIVLERSTNGTNFNPSDSVAISFGESFNGQARFTDLAATEPVVYYRVKLVDVRGEKTYSKILSFRGEGAKNSFALLSPGNQLRYTVNADGYLEIISSSGQVMQRVWVTKGSSTRSISPMKSGIYVLRFQQEQAGKIFVQ